MAPLHTDCRLRGPLCALAAAGALLCLAPAYAANEKCDANDWTYSGDRSSSTTPGTLSLENLVLCRGSTFLRASKADGTHLENNGKNSTWILTGEVHIEFDGGILNTRMATAVFAEGSLISVLAQPAPAQAAQQPKYPVHAELDGAMLDAQTASVTFVGDRPKTVQALGAQGMPVQFSHQPENPAQPEKSARRVGRARRIDFDTGTHVLRLSDAWFSDGSAEGETATLTYNTRDGSFVAETGFRGRIQREGRVPAPRTPDRTTAK